MRGTFFGRRRCSSRCDKRLIDQGDRGVTEMHKPAKALVDQPTDREEIKDRSRRERREWIGRELRRVYQEALSEPLPSDLVDLLKQVKEAEDPAKGE